MDYKGDIHLPRVGDKDPSKIVVSRGFRTIVLRSRTL